MTDQEKREKVIKGMEHCIGDNCSGDKWDKCEYSGHGCIDALLEDALALLKAQEAVKPRHEDNRPISPLRCGYCGAFIFIANSYKARYCFDCGKAVKWDD